jgi:cytoskeletal protein RodZ
MSSRPTSRDPEVKNWIPGQARNDKKIMKTVGSILHEARVAKNLHIRDVEKATKIREKFLESIERDDFASLPSPSYAKGFVRNYAEYLGLQPDKMMAFFRRQMQDISKSTIIPKGMANPINAPFFTLTPARFLALLALGLLVVFFIYLGSQFFQLREPPHLIISTPKNNQQVTEKKIAVEGVTDSDATLLINSVSSIVRDDGRFYEQVSLDPGVNTISVTATSRFGKSITIERKVILEL